MLNTPELAFVLKDFILLVLPFCFAAGLFAQARFQTKRLERDVAELKGAQSRLDDQHARLEQRSIAAIERLGSGIETLATELKNVITTHEARLAHIEKFQVKVG
jgi:hypothetical protein